MESQCHQMNGLHKHISEYRQSSLGNTEGHILVKPLEITGISISPRQLFKNYKVSNFWAGLRPIRRLIKKIFEEKLKRQIVWQSDIWDKIVAVPIRCEMKNAKNNQYFDELRPLNVEDISEDFAKRTGKKRTRDIEQYAKQMQSNIHLHPPVYVSGDVLNYLGGEVDPKEIFMVDGARRIAAFALNHQKHIEISLLILRDDYAKQQKTAGL